MGWISLETPRFLPLLSYTRSSRCFWCRNAENICVGRSRLKLLVSSPAKGAPFLSKKLRSGRILELFLYTEMAQYLNFICVSFKISASVVFLFPCSKIVTRLSRTNNSKLGYWSMAATLRGSTAAVTWENQFLGFLYLPIWVWGSTWRPFRLLELC